MTEDGKKSEKRKPYVRPLLDLVDLARLGRDAIAGDGDGRFVVAQTVVSSSNVTGGTVVLSGSRGGPLIPGDRRR